MIALKIGSGPDRECQYYDNVMFQVRFPDTTPQNTSFADPLTTRQILNIRMKSNRGCGDHIVGVYQGLRLRRGCLDCAEGTTSYPYIRIIEHGT